MLQTIVWSILLVTNVILLITVIGNAISDRKIRKLRETKAEYQLLNIMSQTTLDLLKSQNILNKEEK